MPTPNPHVEKHHLGKPAQKAFASDVRVVEGERAVSAVITTTAVDRDHEVLIPQGCNSKDFQANPVIFYNHAYADFFGGGGLKEKLPVGQCVALKRNDDSIEFKMTFAQRPPNHPAGEEWLADTLFSLYQQGVMRAFSVGFIPIEGRAASDKDLERYGADCRWVISKWKLLEVSCVPLPANQEAVALAVSKGLLTQASADKMFAPAADKSADEAAPSPAEGEGGKAAPDPAKCAECGKETDDLEDGMCPECREAEKSAELPAEPAAGEEAQPAKHVVAEVEIKPADDEPPAGNVKHMHHVVEGADDAEPVVRVHRRIEDPPARGVAVRKLVVAEISKRRGRIYND